MIAAQLNELGISSSQTQQLPEAPPRSGRPHSSSSAVKQVPTSNSNPLDNMESSDSDSEPEESNDRARNDGTLLASDPPKPL